MHMSLLYVLNPVAGRANRRYDYTPLFSNENP